MDPDFNQAERDLLKRSHQIALKEYFAWIEECNEFIKQLEECNHVKRPRLSTGYRQSLIATIARLEGIKTHLERRFLHFDGDYASTSNNSDNNVERSFVWRKIDAAFENRILTDAVINADYIEPRRFLEDISNVVLERVQDTIERHNCIKINTIFKRYLNFTNLRRIINVSIKVLILKTMNSFKHRTCVSGTSSNPHCHLSRSFKNVTVGERCRES
ncbi:hypothetical protein ALC56_05567 [Trachymyrmex septentrionalis]|uniref:Uncharacterized protein n=1 Tax=Trachymyrmex septentrionalis TaxID=34720 RepID=A0A151JYG6_9HYME|nr:hypothetical protein ALC56_05567 [Trachymyrmex septentrionalis]